MARNWSSPVNSFLATGGVKTVWTVGCPSRGALTKLAVVQKSGVAVTFTVDVFSSLADANAYQAGTLTQPDSRRVVKQVPSDAAGTLLKFFTRPEGAFENSDGSPSNKLYKIYLVIAPAGAVAGLQWDVTINVEQSADGS